MAGGRRSGANPTLAKLFLFHVLAYKNVAVPGSVLDTANSWDEGDEKEKEMGEKEEMGEEGKKKGSPRPPSDGRHGSASQTAMV